MLAFCARIYYNSIMKKLEKIQATPEWVNFEREWEAIEPRKVQGGLLYSPEKGALLVESGGRYKLFCEGVDYVQIMRGNGHFKWARGETPFQEGNLFCVSEVGEYEINGACRFAVVRK